MSGRQKRRGRIVELSSGKRGKISCQTRRRANIYEGVSGLVEAVGGREIRNFALRLALKVEDIE